MNNITNRRFSKDFCIIELARKLRLLEIRAAYRQEIFFIRNLNPFTKFELKGGK